MSEALSTSRDVVVMLVSLFGSVARKQCSLQKDVSLCGLMEREERNDTFVTVMYCGL